MTIAGWQNQMPRQPNEQESKKERQGESSEMVHHLSMQNVIQTTLE